MLQCDVALHVEQLGLQFTLPWHSRPQRAQPTEAPEAGSAAGPLPRRGAPRRLVELRVSGLTLRLTPHTQGGGAPPPPPPPPPSRQAKQKSSSPLARSGMLDMLQLVSFCAEDWTIDAGALTSLGAGGHATVRRIFAHAGSVDGRVRITAEVSGAEASERAPLPAEARAEAAALREASRVVVCSLEHGFVQVRATPPRRGAWRCCAWPCSFCHGPSVMVTTRVRGVDVVLGTSPTTCRPMSLHRCDPWSAGIGSCGWWVCRDASRRASRRRSRRVWRDSP